MDFHLRRGPETVSVTVPDGRLAGRFRGPVHTSMDTTESLVLSLLENPKGSPTLAQGVVPQDRIAIVLDGSIPHPELLVAPILDHLEGATAGDFQADLVLSPLADAESARAWFEPLRQRHPTAQLRPLDPTDESSYAYLASSKDGRRIYLRREVVDADLTLLVSNSGYDSVLGLRGTGASLFPALSDQAARIRSRQSAQEFRRDPRVRRKQQLCDEVAWLAGILFSLTVSLDRDGHVDGMWFGDLRTVQECANRHVESEWQVHVPSKGPALAIAAVARSEAKAGWQEVGAALENASRIVQEGGTIAVVCDLDEPLGPTGQWLVDCENPWNVVHGVRMSEEEDCLSTAQIATALGTHRVHLFSHLRPELVETLSMVPIANARELGNLVRHGGDCFVLEDADRVLVAKSVDTVVDS